jgi:predicted amidohydrolase
MPRKVRVTTTSFDTPGQRTAEQNRDQACAFVEAAGAESADLVCLPETFLESGLPADQLPYAEPLPGPTFDALSRLANTHRLWVVAGYSVRTDDGAIENSAVVIDRRGQLAARYGKIHPTISEMTRRNITPGTEGATVVVTDFGRMGLAICYDIGWPDLWAQLAEQGAELVVWPSAYDGGLPLQAYAWTHSYYIVSTVLSEHSRVIDISGAILASTSRWSRLVTTTIDLEKELLHIAPSLGQHETLFRLQQEMGGRVTIQGFTEENFVTLESNDPDWPVARIKEHYGLLNWREYHAAANQVQDEHRRARRSDQPQPATLLATSAV